MKKTILIAAVNSPFAIVIADVYLRYTGVLNAPSATPIPAPEVPTQEIVR